MTIDPVVFMNTLINRFDFTNEDKVILKANAEWGLEIAAEMADHFYTYLGRDEEMNAILNATEGRIHRLRETFVVWFHEMFTGIDDWSAGYSQCRWKIGIVHVKIGIQPQHIVPAMATVVHEVGKKLKVEGKSEELKDALGKICMIDLAFIEQSYIEVATNAVLKETGWSAALFKRLVTNGAASM
ncbi:protoglobin domain-containing protein [Anabaena sp. UHCC 0451]|uniref:protoglobin domain-containing protein n=1 Tax=Anabaena sp. UHCC 0451 TaxID=2055235 RepID=UPI002B210E84|nr:protoglobin domain-containing protein [Anabaena sp. UHCC 0451]MEA5577539.1 protoglobin domain-containing protein [Anabaena sp. UHCC 0451]